MLITIIYFLSLIKNFDFCVRLKLVNKLLAKVKKLIIVY